MNPYIASQELDDVRAQLASRDVIYMVGDQDLGSEMLDVSCGAMLQGPNRYRRGITVFQFMEAYYPEHLGRLEVVEGVAHSSSGIYNSSPGLTALFGW